MNKRTIAFAGSGALLIVAGFFLLNRQEFFYLLGHVSFIITFLAYAQTSLIRLRHIAVASLIVGLVYNTYVHMNMGEGQNLWPVLFWMGVFLAQNVYNSVQAVNRSLEVPAPPPAHSGQLVPSHALSRLECTQQMRHRVQAQAG